MLDPASGSFFSATIFLLTEVAMPSPFPGMDPYLEGNLWTTFHFSFAAEIVRQLSPKLSPKYLVFPVQRFVLDMEEDIAITPTGIYPDAAVVTVAPLPVSGRPEMLAPAPLHLPTVMPARVPHVSLEIRDVEERILVTAIEILSPTNKRGEGRNEYLTKRSNILVSSTHLLEIDLLRSGQRVPMRKPLPAAAYFVFLSRVEKRPVVDIWPIQLPESLPTVPIPLLDGDPDVALNLQSVFNATYDLIGYARAINYTRPPEIALADEAAQWAAERVQSARG